MHEGKGPRVPISSEKPGHSTPPLPRKEAAALAQTCGEQVSLNAPPLKTGIASSNIVLRRVGNVWRTCDTKFSSSYQYSKSVCVRREKGGGPSYFHTFLNVEGLYMGMLQGWPRTEP